MLSANPLLECCSSHFVRARALQAKWLELPYPGRPAVTTWLAGVFKIEALAGALSVRIKYVKQKLDETARKNPLKAQKMGTCHHPFASASETETCPATTLTSIRACCMSARLRCCRMHAYTAH